MSINTEYARQEFMKFPIIQALLDNNILFKSKYYDELHIEHRLYLEVVERFVNEKKA